MGKNATVGRIACPFCPPGELTALSPLSLPGPYSWAGHIFPDNNTSYDFTVWNEPGTDSAYLVRRWGRATRQRAGRAAAARRPGLACLPPRPLPAPAERARLRSPALDAAAQSRRWRFPCCKTTGLTQRARRAQRCALQPAARVCGATYRPLHQVEHWPLPPFCSHVGALR